LRIPANVRNELKACRESDAPHFRDLEAKLDATRIDPFAGDPVRDDLQGCFYVELGDFRLYYFVDESKVEVRFFLCKRYAHGW